MNVSAVSPQLAADACYGYDFDFDLTPNPVVMGADVTASGYVGTTYDGNPLNPQFVLVDWSSPATAIPTDTIGNFSDFFDTTTLALGLQDINAEIEVSPDHDDYYRCLRADISRDGIVNGTDLSRFTTANGANDCTPQNQWCDWADITQDGIVNIVDLTNLSTYTGTTCNDLPHCENNGCFITDITRDGVVNLDDLQAVNLGATGCSDLNNWCNWSDFDKSGEVDAADSLFISAHMFQDCKDLSNQTIKKTVSLNVVDTTDPVINSVSMSPSGTETIGTPLTIDADVTDNGGSGVDTVQAIITKPDTSTEGIIFGGSEPNYSFDYTGLSCGEYTLTVNANDFVGNNAVQKIVTFDVRENYSLTLNGSTVMQGDNAVITGTVLRAGSIPVENWLVEITHPNGVDANQTNTSGEFTYLFDTTGLAVGQHAISAKVTLPYCLTANMAMSSYTSSATLNVVIVEPERGTTSCEVYNEEDEYYQCTVTETTPGSTQDVDVLMNGGIVTLNLDVNGNRDIIVFPDHNIIVSPQNASVTSASWDAATEALNIEADGTGTQEIVVYVNGNNEPNTIVVDGTAISSWVYDDTTKMITFTMEFGSIHGFLMSWYTAPAPPAPAPVAPSGGGGGGGGGGPAYYCGDNQCLNTEDCTSCAADCGECPVEEPAEVPEEEPAGEAPVEEPPVEGGTETPEAELEEGPAPQTPTGLFGLEANTANVLLGLLMLGALLSFGFFYNKKLKNRNK